MAHGAPLLSDSVQAIMRSSAWPKGRVPGERISEKLASIDIEFLKSPEEVLQDRSDIATLSTLAGFTGARGPCERFHVYEGSTVDLALDLPWLDVEKALVIGGGADYGDDTWIVMDYRETSEPPRIVASCWVGDGRTRGIQWEEIAKSFDDLLMKISSETCPKHASSLSNERKRSASGLLRSLLSWLGK